MADKNYSEAYSEVLDILRHTEKAYVDKIPNKMIKVLEDNSAKDYQVDLDYTKSIADMNLKQETLDILAIIYRNYWCTPEEKAEFDKQLSENEAKYQEELHEKYNPDNIFKKAQVEEIHSENLPIEIPKESFYQKLVNFLKRIFKKNK